MSVVYERKMCHCNLQTMLQTKNNKTSFLKKALAVYEKIIYLHVSRQNTYLRNILINFPITQLSIPSIDVVIQESFYRIYA